MDSPNEKLETKSLSPDNTSTEEMDITEKDQDLNSEESKQVKSQSDSASVEDECLQEDTSETENDGRCDEKLENDGISDEKLENDGICDEKIGNEDICDEKIENEDICDEKIENEDICDEKLENTDSKSDTVTNVTAEGQNKSETEAADNGLNQETSDKGRKRKASENDTEDETVEEKKLDIQKTHVDNGQKSEKKDNHSFDEDELNLPPKETFGKGKRARIPNKRYSDISLSNKSFSKVSENGSEKMESENESSGMSIKEEPLVVVTHSVPLVDDASPQPSKKAKVINLSDPKYLKPFKYGWRRELVWRATFEPSKQRLGDIYYYNPQGKKLRSMREVAENLKNKELSLENFSYFKAPLGINDPEKETIRDAKKPNPQASLVKKTFGKSSPRSPKLPPDITDNVSSPKQTTAKISSPKVLSPKISSPKVLSPKISSPRVSSPRVLSPKVSSPKVSSPRVSSPKVSSPKVSSPRVASLKVSSPKVSTPKVSTPKVTSPKFTNSKVSSPKLSSNRGKSKVSSPKVSSPKVSSPRVLSPRQVSNEKVETTVKTRASLKVTQKAKVPPKKDKRVIKSEESMEVESKPTPPKKGRWANFNEGDKPRQPCSIRCEGVHGLVPTLQCRICLCLYHHECIGIPHHQTMLYICKNCQLESQGEKTNQSSTNVAPPPLTPINTFTSAGVQSTTVLPKLQRIPRSDDPTFLTETDQAPDDIDEMPSLIPGPDLIPETTKSVTSPIQSTVNEYKSIVGSVTSWLPHNSKIVDNIPQNCEEPTEVPRPQYVEFLGGRKFLVIPKHNFMSVSPTVATSAVTRTGIPKIPDNLNINKTSINPENLTADAEPDPVIKPTSESPSKPENSHVPEDSEVIERTEPVDDAEMDKKSSEDFKNVDTNEEATPPVVKPKKRTIKLSSITNSEEREENKFMDNYLQNLSYGYNTLLYVFQYLKVQDLLRAGCVCTMWRDIASHPMLWRTVRMKNSQVHSFEGLANSLKKHGTRHLDLRKMLLPNGGDEIWPEFSKAIEKVDTLRKIELCRCPASVVEKLATSNPHLEVINAVTIKCESMDLEPLKGLTDIRELRLKSTGGLTLKSNLDSLKDMKELRHLSLTSIRDLDKMNLSVISELKNLESLDLGECTDFPESFGSEILVKLDKLEKLRLEKGQGACHTFEILDAVKDMHRLEQLELVNFDIKAGFDKALGVCQNIKKLLIIPTYISQSATTNHMVLGGVLRLQKTLSHFVWGVTLELLRVTELFVDQCEEPEKKERREKKATGNGDSIPVLKPVPLLMDRDNEIPPAHDPPQVEILALPSLQKLLMQNLPTTRVKILKIPFHATWRQSITDSVN